MLWFKSISYSTSLNESAVEGRGPLTSSPAAVFQVLFVVLSVLSVLGNFLVLMTIMRSRSLHSSIHWLLVNITISDILLAIFVLPRYVFLQYFSYAEGARSNIVCKLLSSLTVSWVGINAQVFTLIVIAIERYVTVVHRHRGRWTKTTLKVVIVSSWLYAIAFTIPDFIFIRYSAEKANCIYNWSQIAHETWAFIRLFACGPLPLVAMSYLYVRIVYDLWIKNRNIVMEASHVVIMASRKRFTKIVITISIIYGLCLIPIMTIWLIDNLVNAISNLYVFLAVSHLILLFNAAIKPIIYCIQSQQFRKCMLVMLWKQNSVASDEIGDFNTNYGGEYPEYPRSERSPGSNVYQTRQPSGIAQESHYELETCMSLEMRRITQSDSHGFSEEPKHDSSYQSNKRTSRTSKGSLYNGKVHTQSKTVFTSDSNAIINFDSSDSDDDQKEFDKIRYGGIWMGSKERDAWHEIQLVSPSKSDNHSVELHIPPTASSKKNPTTSANEHCEDDIQDNVMEKQTMISISKPREVLEMSEDPQKPLEWETPSDKNEDNEQRNKTNKDCEEKMVKYAECSLALCSSLQPPFEDDGKHDKENTVPKMEVISTFHTKEIALETEVDFQQNGFEKRTKDYGSHTQAESTIKDNSQNTDHVLEETSLNGVHNGSKNDVPGFINKVQNKNSENVDYTTQSIPTSLDAESNCDASSWNRGNDVSTKADANIANGDLSATISQILPKSEKASHLEKILNSTLKKGMEMPATKVENQERHLEHTKDADNMDASFETFIEKSSLDKRQDHEELEDQFGGVWLGPNPELIAKSEETSIEFNSSGSQKIQDDYGGIWLGNIPSQDRRTSLIHTNIAHEGIKKGMENGQCVNEKGNVAVSNKKRDVQTVEDEKLSGEFPNNEDVIKSGLSEGEQDNDCIKNRIPKLQNNTNSNSTEEQNHKDHDVESRIENQLKKVKSKTSRNRSVAPKNLTSKTNKAGQKKAPAALNKIKEVNMHLKPASNSIHPSDNLPDSQKKETKYDKGKQVWLREKDKLKMMNKLKYLDINS